MNNPAKLVIRAIRKVAKATIPPPVCWRGRYNTWQDAANASGGYATALVLERIVDSARKVRDGLKAYERDGVAFDHATHNFHLLTALLIALGYCRASLKVLDFGGALGSLYFQHRSILPGIGVPLASWTVVEQKHIAEIGKAQFRDDILRFLDHLPPVSPGDPPADLLILSSVLQYLENPIEFLTETLSQGYPFVFIDRTAFTVDEASRLTVQRVRPPIYEASYPCWFLSETELLRCVANASYETLFSFDAFDTANIPSRFRGFLFRKNTSSVTRGGRDG